MPAARVSKAATSDLVPAVERERLIGDVQDRADAVLDDGLLQLGRVDLDLLIPPRRDHADLQLRHLADLLFERHLSQQLVGLAPGRRVRRGRARHAAEDGVAVRHFRPGRSSRDGGSALSPREAGARREGVQG
ncbi:MAG: hypothetical protein LC800_09490 [Acidobacteria bacterium]|nr:hypothetical protein [Acidobacteriota bacterium]